MIDYRELLKKYMQVVAAAEGVLYLSYIPWIGEGVISPDEEAELKALGNEACGPGDDD